MEGMVAAGVATMAGVAAMAEAETAEAGARWHHVR
jgi:hypothetical protein